MKQPIAWFVSLLASLVVGSAAPGCGTYADSPAGAGASGGSAGRGGSAGSAGGGGSAGSSGSADSGASADSGGADGRTPDSGAPDTGVTTVACGTTMCSSVDVMGVGTLQPCCAQGEMNACGLVVQGFCFTRTPGTSNPICGDVPLQTTTGMTVLVPGCCTVTSVCGGNLGSPLGCNELTPFTGQPGAPCGPDAAPPPTIEGGLDSSSDSSDSGSDSMGDSSSPEAGGDARDTGQGDSDARPSDARSDG